MTDPMAAARQRMVERQIAGRGIADPRVLAAMAAVPRHEFVPAELADLAHDDQPLPIGAGQTISQPYMVAWMAEAARIAPTDTVLEVGAGCGYAAAVLARLAARVFTIERLPALAALARGHVARLGIENIWLREGDGTLGWPEAAPFDAILVAAGAPLVGPVLRGQLAMGGRMLVPVGAGRDGQQLLRVTRTGPDAFAEEALGACTFVPLIGAEGWDAP